MPPTIRYKPPTRGTSSLAIGGIVRGAVTAHGTVTVTFHTAPRSNVTITLRLTRMTAVLVGHGTHRKHVTQTIVLQSVTLHAKTDRLGQLRDSIHITYVPRKPTKASLTVALRTRHSTVTHTMRITVTPPPPPHKAPSHRHK